MAPPAQDPLVEEVHAVRAQLVAAAERRDREAYDRLLTGGFTFVHATGGMETREEYIAKAVAGGHLFQRAERELIDETLHLYPGPTAVVVSAVVFRNRSDGVETRLRGTNVFVEVGDRWQWAAGHSTRLPNRPPAVAVDHATLYPRYAGEYRVGPERTLTVSTDGAVLSALVTGFRPGELVPRSPTEFIWFNPELNVFSEVVFVIGDGGVPSEAIYRRDGLEVWRARRVR
jgi:hypothetical protein